MNDYINRSTAIKTAIEAVDNWDGGYNVIRAQMIETALMALPSKEVCDAIKQNAEEIQRSGFKGKEFRFNINGRLFAVRELPQ